MPRRVASSGQGALAGGKDKRGDQSAERKEYIPGGGTNQLRGKCLYLEGGPGSVTLSTQSVKFGCEAP
eukprot:730835-Prorocentrum_minimum.AAC.1